MTNYTKSAEYLVYSVTRMPLPIRPSGFTLSSTVDIGDGLMASIRQASCPSTCADADSVVPRAGVSGAAPPAANTW